MQLENDSSYKEENDYLKPLIPSGKFIPET